MMGFVADILADTSGLLADLWLCPILNTRDVGAVTPEDQQGQQDAQDQNRAGIQKDNEER
jgi:hypothetical protein